MDKGFKAELERQYSPDLWNTRYSAETVGQKHVEAMKAASEIARQLVGCSLDVAYGESEGEKLDVYHGNGLTDESEVFVFIHGGFWQNKEINKDTSASLVGPLTSRGAVVVIVGYDLAPTVRIATMMEQVERAVAYVIDQFPHSRGIFVGGHSTGGHLAAMMMSVDWREKYQSDLVKGFFLISGIFDVTPLVHTSVNNHLELSVEEARQSSPILFFEEACRLSRRCKVLVAVAENDSPEFKRQSAEYAQCLKEGKIRVKSIEVIGEDHYSIMENMDQENFELIKILIKLMHSH